MPTAAAGRRSSWCLSKAAKFAARSKYELYVLLADADEKVVAIAERMQGLPSTVRQNLMPLFLLR